MHKVSQTLSKEEPASKKDLSKNKTAKEKKKPRPEPPKLPRLLKQEDVLLNRFVVKGVLGDGGFAQVHLGFDRVTGKECAIKVESDVTNRKRMKLEITVFAMLRGKKHIPMLLAMGTLPGSHFIIMQLLGKSLSDIRRQLPHRCLTKPTLYRTLQQIAVALSHVHSIGFIHRDLKPSNCCVGSVDITRIYLLDFGLTRQVVDCTGNFRRCRKRTGLRGTLRYLSLDGHQRKELGPNNDLAAFIYTAVELSEGTLPWSKVTEEKHIEHCKLNTPVSKLIENCPPLVKLADYIFSMPWDTMPDYPFIFSELAKAIPEGVTEHQPPYDWQYLSCDLNHKAKMDENEIKAKSVGPRSNYSLALSNNTNNTNNIHTVTTSAKSDVMQLGNNA